MCPKGYGMDYEDMNEEGLPQEEEDQQGAGQSQAEQGMQQPAQSRIDGRPKNNIYMPGTGKGTGRTAIRVGTINRDGSASPVSAMGAATGPLSQPIAKFSPEELQQMAGQNQGGGGGGAGGSGARPGRIDGRPRNNIYMPGTGPGTGRTAIRVGTLNRDGSASPVSALGAATGPLSQPIAKFSPDQLKQIYEQGQGGGGAGGGDGSDAGGGARAGRIDGRPKNNIYMPGTGPGTGRTAIRVGTMNRDGSASPVSALGAATGSLTQPTSRLFEQRQPTSEFAQQQRQTNVANAMANGSFDAIRNKFNSSNSGHYMDESGAISQRGTGGQFVSAPDGMGGNKMVRLPDKPAAAAPAPNPAPAGAMTPAPATTAPRPPLAAAGNAPKTSFADGLVNGVMPGAAKPAAAMPGPPKQLLTAAGSVTPKPPAPAVSAPMSPLTGNLLKGVMGTPTPKPPLAGAANVTPKPPLAAAGNPAPAPATPPSASKATFEGQSREAFFGAAAQRQKMDNKYAKWNGRP